VEEKMEHKNTQEQIFDASVELFHQKGYAGTTIREIARMVGIKESSIYNHYTNKEEILDCILADFKSGIASNRPSENELANLVTAISPAEIIKLIFLKYVRNEDVKYDKIAKIIFIEQYINKRAGDFFMKYMVEEPLEYYKKIFSMLVAEGRIKDYDYTSLTEELHYGFLGLMMEFVHIKAEEQSDKGMLQKMVRHVDFVFEQVQII
jgi:AcrR family transcriptional regulator